MPGVESATLMGNRIGSGWSNNTGAWVDGQTPLGTGQFAPMRWNVAGPDYFRTLGVAVLLGREFNDADSENAPRAAVVNQTFVDRYLKDRPPLGHTVGLGRNSDGSSPS
ncbi:MAG: ABC transporter permease [Ignavibacteriota bacterium]